MAFEPHACRVDCEIRAAAGGRLGDEKRPRPYSEVRLTMPFTDQPEDGFLAPVGWVAPLLIAIVLVLIVLACLLGVHT
jgi:hypothetical protein